MERIGRKVDGVAARMVRASIYKPLPPKIKRDLKRLTIWTAVILLMSILGAVLSASNDSDIATEGQQVVVLSQQASETQNLSTALSLQVLQYKQEGNNKAAQRVAKQASNAEKLAGYSQTSWLSAYNQWARDSSPGVLDELLHFLPLAGVSLSSVMLGAILSFAILRFVELSRFVEEASA
jgi:hypothetical protein